MPIPVSNVVQERYLPEGSSYYRRALKLYSSSLVPDLEIRVRFSVKVAPTSRIILTDFCAWI